MSKFISGIWKRENILALVLIIGAILGALGVPQQLGFTSEQLVLALLAVLGFDAIVERVGYLERIETNIVNLENKLEPPQINADDLFLPREAMKPFLSWLGDCEEMWFAGKDLNELLSSFGEHIQKAAIEQKKRFRFLIIDPNDEALINKLATSSYLRPDTHSRKSVVTLSLAILKRMGENTPKGSIEVKLANWVPMYSYVISDGQKPHGRMSVEFFGYKITSAERRHLMLARVRDKQNFEFHLQQFEKMWGDAKPVSE